MTGIMSLLKGVSVAYFLSVLCLSSAELSTSRLQRAVNTFSVNLLKELSGAEPENLVVSPISVSTLLAILHQGAGLNTSRQLESVLRLTQRESKEGYGRLSRSFGAARNTSAVLEVANRVFLNQGLELRQEFQDLVSQDFQAGVEQVDFLSGEGAATINSWVSQATHGRIPNIVGTVVPPDTVLVLANAIYFKSPWRHPFSRWTTTDKAFSPRQGSEVTVPFMHLGKRLRAGEDEALGVKWVQLPFDVSIPATATGETLPAALEPAPLHDSRSVITGAAKHPSAGKVQNSGEVLVLPFGDHIYRLTILLRLAVDNNLFHHPRAASASGVCLAATICNPDGPILYNCRTPDPFRSFVENVI